MRTWARQLSDTENDSNVTDAELTALVNRHLTEVYDALIAAAPPEYYASTTTVTTVNGTTAYALASDFHSLLGVYVNESSDERRPLLAMPEGARGSYKAPTGAWTVTLEYVPAAGTLADQAETFDGVSGWEELIVNMVARDVCTKRQSDPGVILDTIANLKARINSRSRNRDKGAGKKVFDTDEAYATTWPWGWSGNSRLTAYRLRAGNIELYESLWGLP